MATAGDLAARGKDQLRVVRGMARRSLDRRSVMRQRHQASPPFRQALAADVRANLNYRGESRGPLSRTELVAETIRLTWTSDAFLAQVLYRGRVALLRRGVPVLPRVCHLAAMASSQVCIGDPVVIQPGLYLPHGQVVVDGVTEIGRDVILFPWTTIGLRGGDFRGPRIGAGTHVGTGSKIIGPIQVGSSCRVGANAVVVADAQAGATLVGVPARPTARVD